MIVVCGRDGLMVDTTLHATITRPTVLYRGFAVKEAEARDTAGHPAPLPQLHFIQSRTFLWQWTWLPSYVGLVDKPINALSSHVPAHNRFAR